MIENANPASAGHSHLSRLLQPPAGIPDDRPRLTHDQAQQTVNRWVDDLFDAERGDDAITLGFLFDFADEQGISYAGAAMLSHFSGIPINATRGPLESLVEQGCITRFTTYPSTMLANVLPFTMERATMRCCVYCGAQPQVADRVIPQKRGGTYHHQNIVTACWVCNSRKRDRDLSSVGMEMLFPDGWRAL